LLDGFYAFYRDFFFEFTVFMFAVFDPAKPASFTFVFESFRIDFNCRFFF